MTICEIFERYTKGSTGFVVAIETHCGFCATRSEIARIAAASQDAADFQRIWENETFWQDAVPLFYRDADPGIREAAHDGVGNHD